VAVMVALVVAVALAPGMVQANVGQKLLKCIF
jgi:hypothetical protein